ncbi:MAG TPA: carboxypeptidase regulatory-like domain-containing protein [Gemmatimonadales bacterium]|nr:carboxypeptidase regulatory-like domain-containing protein [Gemmatimonadales bacterium]
MRTVRGDVHDTAGQPIDQVQVLALSAGRTTRTGADGRFQLDSFPREEERFLFRRLGFNPVEATVVITRTDEEVIVRMTPLAQELKPIVVRGRRSGVFGTVTDVADQPVAGVEVTVLGGAVATHTDGLGRFSLPSVPAGTFMMMVRKRGYFVVRHSVTLPVGEALDLAVLLAPVPSGLSHQKISRLAGFGGVLGWAWDAHAARRVRCTGGNATFAPREEFASQGGTRLDYALPRASSVLVRGFNREELRKYAVYIDGQDATGWPLSAIAAADVEAVEVYRGATPNRGPLSLVPFSTTPTSSYFTVAGSCPGGTIWVWLR